MPLNLFKKPEDLMVENMVHGITPVGKDIKAMLEIASLPLVDPQHLARYKEHVNHPLRVNEMDVFVAALKEYQVSLALCEDAGIFFADLTKVEQVKEKLSRVAFNDEYQEVGLPWVALVKLMWESGNKLASIHVFLEGFEFMIFSKEQKPKKAFIPKPLKA